MVKKLLWTVVFVASGYFSFGATAVPAGAASATTAAAVSSAAQTAASPESAYTAAAREARIARLGGDIEKAARFWEEAWRIAQAAGAEDASIAVRIECARCAIALGETEKARNLLEPIVRTASNTTLRREAEALAAMLANDGTQSGAGALIPASYTLLGAGRESLVLTPDPTILGGSVGEASRSVSNASGTIAKASGALSKGSDTLSKPSGTVSKASGVPLMAHKLQTGLFSSYQNAENQIARLAKKGFAAALETRTVSGKTMYAVVVGADTTNNAVGSSIMRLKDAGFESFPVE